MLTVYSDEHQKQDGAVELSEGKLVPCFEMPQRAHIVLDRVKAVGLGRVLEPTSHGLSPILRVHAKSLVDFLATVWDRWTSEGRDWDILPECSVGPRMRRDRLPEGVDALIGYFVFDVATPINSGTYEAALSSANVALTGVDEVLNGQRGVFSLCRPPGHHAGHDYMGGYCFFNNAAVAAQSALDRGAKKVAILDVDYHHGNGTQDIFYTRNDVLFVSIHGHPRTEYPFYIGYEDELGESVGRGFNFNFPLPPGTAFDIWQEALEQALKHINDFKADVLIVSLGVDTFKDDPISKFMLESSDFRIIGKQIGLLNLPTLFVLEGGYAVDEIGINAVNVLTGFEGE